MITKKKKVLIIKQIQPVKTTVRLAALRIRRLISEEVFKVLNTLALAPSLYLRGNYFPLHHKHIEVQNFSICSPKLGVSQTVTFHVTSVNSYPALLALDTKDRFLSLTSHAPIHLICRRIFSTEQ